MGIFISARAAKRSWTFRNVEFFEISWSNKDVVTGFTHMHTWEVSKSWRNIMDSSYMSKMSSKNRSKPICHLPFLPIIMEVEKLPVIERKLIFQGRMFHFHSGNSLNLLVALGKVGASEQNHLRWFDPSLTYTDEKTQWFTNVWIRSGTKKREALNSQILFVQHGVLMSFFVFPNAPPFLGATKRPICRCFGHNSNFWGFVQLPASDFLRGAEFGLCRISSGGQRWIFLSDFDSG